MHELQSVPPTTLYKYTTVETARDILHGGKLRFSSPIEFNDALDCQWDILAPAYTDANQQLFKTLIEEVIRGGDAWPEDGDEVRRLEWDMVRVQYEAVPHDSRDAWIADYLLKATRPEIRKRQADSWREEQSPMRMLCLSSTVVSPLMWAHYGDSNRGVALEFKTSILEETYRVPCKGVRYAASPPEVIDGEQAVRSAVYGSEPPRPNPEAWSLAKHTDWQYEMEWRFAFRSLRETDIDYTDMAFPPEALVGMIAGSRTDRGEFDCLRYRAARINPDIQCFEIRPHPSAFKLEKHPIEPPPPG